MLKKTVFSIYAFTIVILYSSLSILYFFSLNSIFLLSQFYISSLSSFILREKKCVCPLQTHPLSVVTFPPSNSSSFSPPPKNLSTADSSCQKKNSWTISTTLSPDLSSELAPYHRQSWPAVAPLTTANAARRARPATTWCGRAAADASSASPTARRACASAGGAVGAARCAARATARTRSACARSSARSAAAPARAPAPRAVCAVSARHKKEVKEDV